MRKSLLHARREAFYVAVRRGVVISKLTECLACTGHGAWPSVRTFVHAVDLRWCDIVERLATLCACLCMGACVCSGQIFSSKAMPRGSFGYWLLIVFVGTIISTAILVMIGLVIFESYRAFKFATLYDDIRCVPCGGVVNVEALEGGTGGLGVGPNDHSYSH